MKNFIDMRDKIEKPRCEHCWCIETSSGFSLTGSSYIKDHWQCCNCGTKKKKSGYLGL